VQVPASKTALLLEPKVQLLANYLLTESTELVPTPDQELGVRYLQAERITGESPVAVRKLLDRLVEKKVLDTRFVSKLVLCPKCGSSDTPTHYCCPYCKSIEIDKKALFEHLACGVIEKEDNFKRDGQLICPHCARELGQLGVTHKAVGAWFQCKACHKPFNKPVSFHVCGRCRNFFPIEEAGLIDVYAYRLSKEAEGDLRSGGMFLKPLKEVLEREGYTVMVGGTLRGASGENHPFDLIGSKNGDDKNEIVAVDVVSSDRLVGENSVTTMFAKRYDSNPGKSILVAIPGIVAAGKRLAAMYRITLIEAASAPEASEKLRASISS
jgi:hypothetical protein